MSITNGINRTTISEGGGREITSVRKAKEKEREYFKILFVLIWQKNPPVLEMSAVGIDSHSDP